MTTTAKHDSNARNARKSTGPRTSKGKATVARNALAHGLLSTAPVVPGETAEAWEEHRNGIVGALAPVGALEAELAGRVALLLWRLRRVSAHEAGTITAEVAAAQIPDPDDSRAAHDRKRLEQSHEELPQLEAGEGRALMQLEVLRALPEMADDDLVPGEVVRDILITACMVQEWRKDKDEPDLRSEEFLSAVGVPAELHNEPWEWEGWTAGTLRQGLARIALAGHLDPARLRSWVIQDRESVNQSQAKGARKLRRRTEDIEQRIDSRQALAVQRSTLPDSLACRVTRYEAHLGRQLALALHTLERLQLVRKGQQVPPPAALDVTVSGAEGATG